jgi:hypothetical protein
LAAANSSATLRIGVAAKDLPALVAALGRDLDDASLLADVANGMLFTEGAPLAPVRKAALNQGGYAVALSAEAGERWGYRPQGLPWMKALKARWDPGNLFNPGAFIV